MTPLIGCSRQIGKARMLTEMLREALSGGKEVAPVVDAPQPEGYDPVAECRPNP